MNDGTIQSVAFTVRPEREATPLTLTGIQFPAAWKPPILGLARVLYGREEDAVSMPVRSLNAAVSALVPHLLTTPMWGWLKQSERPMSELDPWLVTDLSGEELPIWAIMRAWVDHHFGHLDAVGTVREQMRHQDLQFESLVRELKVPTCTNGTANTSSFYRKMVPAWLAKNLADRGVTLAVYGEEVPLLRVPCEDGAELMTWPPIQYRRKERAGAYSYSVRITVQTHVGCPRPRIHFHYGVRRWVLKPLWDGKTLFLRREAKSVYVRVPDEWIGLPSTGSFAMAHLEGERVNGCRVPVWSGSVPEIAGRLGVPFPTAEEFAADPRRWMESSDSSGIEAAAVEKTPKWHPVQTGLGLDEHERITRRIASALCEELQLCDPLVRLPLVRKRAPHVLMEDPRAVASGVRCAALVRSVAPQITIEVLYRTPEFRDMQVNRLQDLLLGDPPAPRRRGQPHEPLMPAAAADEVEVALPGGRLRILSRAIGAVGAPLSPRDNAKLGDYRRSATEERVRLVEREANLAIEPSLAIVDLPDYRLRERRPAEPERDPLVAIRLGLARRGRLSKFVDGQPGDDLQHRCESAAREAFRQLGYLPAPIGFSLKSGDNLPAPLLVASVWVIRLNRTRGRNAIVLPVVTLLDTSDLQVKAWIPDGKLIRPLHQAQLDIVQMDPGVLRRTNEAEQLLALNNFLIRELPREGWSDILVLAEAQNGRLTWGGLRNGEVKFGHFVFNPKGAATPVERLGARMRLVRLRTGLNCETPEWFTYGAGANAGYRQGMWTDPNLPRHFFSIDEKPSTMRGGRRGKQIDPGELYAQPSILEILPIALQDGDSPELWAQAVYEWKRMSGVLTQGSTLRPIPLEFARHTRRYARAISPYVDPVLWSELDGDDATRDS
jgi:hypothetical protein